MYQQQNMAPNRYMPMNGSRPRGLNDSNKATLSNTEWRRPFREDPSVMERLRKGAWAAPEEINIRRDVSHLLKDSGGFTTVTSLNLFDPKGNSTVLREFVKQKSGADRVADYNKRFINEENKRSSVSQYNPEYYSALNSGLYDKYFKQNEMNLDISDLSPYTNRPNAYGQASNSTFLPPIGSNQLTNPQLGNQPQPNNGFGYQNYSQFLNPNIGYTIYDQNGRTNVPAQNSFSTQGLPFTPQLQHKNRLSIYDTPCACLECQKNAKNGIVPAISTGDYLYGGYF
jgi:hypothetical protein